MENEQEEIEKLELPEIVVGEPEPEAKVDVSTEAPAQEQPVDEPAPVEDDLHARFEEMKKREQTEREARIAAEREARANKATAEHYQGAVRDSQLNELTLYLANLDVREESITEQRAIALSEGDYAKEARLTKELQRTLVEKDRVQRGKELLEKQELTPVQPQTVKNPTIEEQTAHLNPASRDWLRAHPDVLQDPVKWKKALALHEYATSYMGVAADTPEYFEFLETKLGYRSDPVETTPDKKPVAKKDSSNAGYAAPPSKNAPLSERLRTTPGARVVLTKDQEAFCESQGYDKKQYAEGLRKAILAGAYDAKGL
jgi:hypothetical protein